MNQHKKEFADTTEVRCYKNVEDGEKFAHLNALVSVGVGVRNGGRTLRYALDTIINQDYQNLEIIISDNDSADDTALIALEYQRRDSRIIYHRQPIFLTALENFRFVLDQAQGEYFMWAAHDDTRSLDYVSQLISGMSGDPECIIGFGDLYVSYSIESEGQITPYPFSTTGLSTCQRMRKAAHMCYHFYGLWRADALRSIRFHPCIWSPDRPIMVAAAYLGTFKYVPGPRFTYNVVPKSDLERTIYQDGKTSFNKYNGMLELIIATYKTSAEIGGVVIGLVAVWYVMEPHVLHLPNFIVRKLKKAIFTNT